MTALPDHTTPEQLAETYGWSERRVREIARSLGACRIMGNRMVLLPDDVKAILEASRPCPLNSIDVGKSGITGARLPDGDYEVLRAFRSRKPPNELPHQKNKSTGKVILMGRSRSSRLHKQP